MRTYLDASPVIYAVEQTTGFYPRVDARLAVTGIVVVSSDLTRMECLVHPLRGGDTALVQNFEDFFAHRVNEMVQFTPALFRRAAEIRAQFNFRTPDALHLAAAVEAACNVLPTNDAQLTRFPGITVEVV
jgi:uncharacterized protein